MHKNPSARLASSLAFNRPLTHKKYYVTAISPAAEMEATGGRAVLGKERIKPCTPRVKEKVHVGRRIAHSNAPESFILLKLLTFEGTTHSEGPPNGATGPNYILCKQEFFPARFLEKLAKSCFPRMRRTRSIGRPCGQLLFVCFVCAAASATSAEDDNDESTTSPANEAG